MTHELHGILAEWPRNLHEMIRVRLDEFTIDLRVWSRGRRGDFLKPTRAGLTLSLHHLPDLADAVNAALAHARNTGLLADDGEIP
jgi:hypothetical protein